MNNFLGFSIVVGISYFAFQIYRKIKAAIELDKTLPQYLENLLGEKPTSFNVNLEFSGTSIEIVFSQRIIDENEKPLENLESLQPDFFVKGFEYSKDGIHPKTKEEIDIISSYGGEVIFSPGDVVYSSTNFQTIKKLPSKHGKGNFLSRDSHPIGLKNILTEP